MKSWKPILSGIAVGYMLTDMIFMGLTMLHGTTPTLIPDGGGDHVQPGNIQITGPVYGGTDDILYAIDVDTGFAYTSSTRGDIDFISEGKRFSYMQTEPLRLTFTHPVCIRYHGEHRYPTDGGWFSFGGIVPGGCPWEKGDE